MEIKKNNVFRIDPETLQLQYLATRSFFHSIQPFAFDLLRIQLKIPASYEIYRFPLT